MAILEALQAALGAEVVLAPGEADLARHLRDYKYAAPSNAAPVGVAYPRTTEQVSAILRLCHQAGQTVAVQGGLTGLTGAAVPQSGELILSLERMRDIEQIDPAASTMTVQAGVKLQAAQIAADAAGLLFPLDIGARGSCTIGGNIATNAGGNRVLRYGMMRDLVLGVEGVLADGTIVGGLNKMLKNNTAYDLKQLLIGSEGTLGVITRAVLRLYPKPASVCTALCALAGYDQVLALLARARSGLGPTLSAFEAMWTDYYALGAGTLARGAPLSVEYPIYVLLDALGSDPAADQARLEALIGQAIEDGIVIDAAIAQSERDAKDLWTIRDVAAELQRLFYPSVSFDISVPTGQIAQFVDAVRAALAAQDFGARALYFGHVADANLHMEVKVDQGELPRGRIEETVYAVVRDFGGSVSAEHGIGLSKKRYLSHSRSPAEMQVMRTLRQALDPDRILNPGKVFD
jgi:FAD/FMN-containing dehydrogenase